MVTVNPGDVCALHPERDWNDCRSNPMPYTQYKATLWINGEEEDAEISLTEEDAVAWATSCEEDGQRGYDYFYTVAELVPVAEIDRLRAIEAAARFVAFDDFDEEAQRQHCWDELRRLLDGAS